MPPQRDAALTAPYPYLTHLITHHGQLTLIPADNCGRRRKAKQNRPESTRNIPREEPVRFSTGPAAYPSSSGRPSRRVRRLSPTEERYNDPLDDIPDYPPPSFQEAISSPAVSVCPSTTTLGRFTTPQASRHNSHSDSESDDASLDIIDTGTVPRSLESTAERTSLQSQTLTRGRGILDFDPDDIGRAPSFSDSRFQRRHLSLSPLRTLFPSRTSRESGHALSAQSTPSPQSLTYSHSSPFIRSTTSLRNPTASAPLPPPSPSSPPSIRSENFLASRRFFSHKGKERATSEALDSWEIVGSELPAVPTTPLHPEDVSPVHDISSANTLPQSPVSTASTPAHPLSERDRLAKAKSRTPLPIPNPARERERRPPPPPPPPALAPGEAPPIVTVQVPPHPPRVPEGLLIDLDGAETPDGNAP
ncbi:hypothetical protein C8F04DRAFT_669531 [Mycena alexandri]|uniref:Uncharacterized protein n=1 Tax=Mycena alexandri TaxID=1745969 RepID=A0AAD6SSX8_9AGAR|nr:hypothetical protein C8F04DRAFT_669531 [Mycena alexandri]